MATPKVTIPRSAVWEKFRWITDYVPCFGISGNNVHVITEPMTFYETFKSMVQRAEKRIVIASLYLGTDNLEKDLVHTIEEACERAAASGNKDFEVHILLDYQRGSRGGNKSSRSMLLPLLEKYGNHAQVYLYHTPDLRGVLKSYMPERFNEVIGLTHMKIYLVDDDFIISGANLSQSYFTDRQDRYLQFCQCPDMANFLCDIVQTVSEFSFHLQCSNHTSYPVNTPHPYEDTDGGEAYKVFAKERIQKVCSFWKSYTSSNECDRDTSVDTWLFPLLQMGPFGIKDDEQVTDRLFHQSDNNDKILLASGYFNLTSRYMDVVINESKAKYEILTAAPEANGFFGARGVSGYIPDVYTLIARQFFSQVCKKGQDFRITIFEYYRKHWTFHCKGLWFYMPNCDFPVLTLIGSPNFGYRSVYRDLEIQLAVVTANPCLQEQLKQEHQRLYESALQVSDDTFQQPERTVPVFPRLVTGIIKNFF